MRKLFFGLATLLLSSVAFATPTVVVNSPANGSTANSPVSVSATATPTSGYQITGWHVYLDGVDQTSLYQTNCQPNCGTDSGSLTVTTGTHTLIARAWDTSGTNGSATVTFTVVSPQVTVTIAQPTAGSTVCAPVTINASATTTTVGATITGWQINNGNTMLWNGTTHSASLSQNLQLSAGSYNLGVKAFDSSGLNSITFLSTPIIVASPTSSDCGISITPATTLAAETGNNTGASSYFSGFPNGDEAATNVSDVDMHNLLYAGNTTKIFPTVILWWCQTGGPTAHVVSATTICRSHVENGNSYDNPATIAQVDDDAIARHIDGMLLDWYGQGRTDANFANQDSHAANFVNDMNGRAGVPLQYAFMLDHSYSYTCAANNASGSTGTPGWQSMGYASITACMYGEINKDLDYLNTHYFTGAAAYIDPADNHIPVVPFITQSSPEFQAGCTYTYQTCWTTVWNNVNTHTSAYSHPVDLILENNGNFSPAYTHGAYQWVGNSHSLSPTYSTDEGIGVIDAFINSAKANTSKVAWGGAWKGFNDSVASWGTGRLMSQQCGKTWLDTFAAWTYNSYFGTGNQLRFMQPVTWSDYEEGTEIESGIASCLTVTSSLSGTKLSWVTTGTGSQNNIDHYTVYVSSDQNNLAILQDNIAPTTTSLDLTQYNVKAGTYYLYVKMVAKSSLSNSMSSASTWTIIANPLPPHCQ